MTQRVEVLRIFLGIALMSDRHKGEDMNSKVFGQKEVFAEYINEKTH